jgi:hypothetical protein
MIDKTDKILKEMIELNKNTKDNITLPYIEYLKQKYKCFLAGEQKAREEVIREIEKIKVKHKTLLPDYRIGYDLALKELKQKLQEKKK